MKTSKNSNRNKKALAFAVLFATLVFASFGCTSAATIYVPDDYTRIQWAVDYATAGDTLIVREGTYEENVDVNKSLTIESERGYNFTIIHAANPDKPVLKISADNVSIIGFTIKNAIGGFPYFPAGVELPNTNYCLILNNNISDNWAGVSVKGDDFPYNSSNNMITNNIISNNRAAGVSLGFTSSNVIGRNIISGNHNKGISMGATSNNTIAINSILNNEVGIGSSGSPVENNVIFSNYISDNHNAGIHFGFNTLNKTIFDHSNNTISDNTISNNWQGIALRSSLYNNISRNNISNNHVGIELDKKALNNTIYLNNFIANAENTQCDFCSLFNLINIWNSTSRITYTYNNKTYSNYLGNYWGDYIGTDDDQDGIGGDPYSTDLDKDYYPLMERFGNYTKAEKEEREVPGFEAVFVIAGLLAVAYLLRRRG